MSDKITTLLAKRDFSQRLCEATADLKVSCQEILEYASAKQKQRAEPWQQTIIDKLTRALKNYDRLMKDDENEG